jgi:hypothetical protein
MPNRKLEIVTRLINEIPEQYRESIDQAMVTWWANIRPEGGLRLTRHGYEILNNILKMESWELDLTDRPRIDKRIVLDMDRKLEWPYFLDFNPRKKSRRIVFFSSREALMATMYGDLRAWLDHHGSR